MEGSGTPTVLAMTLSMTKLNPAAPSANGTNVKLMASNGTSELKPMNPGDVAVKLPTAPPTEKLVG